MSLDVVALVFTEPLIAIKVVECEPPLMTNDYGLVTGKVTLTCKSGYRLVDLMHKEQPIWVLGNTQAYQVRGYLESVRFLSMDEAELVLSRITKA